MKELLHFFLKILKRNQYYDSEYYCSSELLLIEISSSSEGGNIKHFFLQPKMLHLLKYFGPSLDSRLRSNSKCSLSRNSVADLMCAKLHNWKYDFIILKKFYN